MHEDILNELRTPVFLINKHNFIKYINLIGEEFFGYSAKLIIGKPLDNFISNDSSVFNLLDRVRKSRLGLTEESLDFGNINFPNRKVRVHILPSGSDNDIIVQISELTISELFQKQALNTKISKSFSSMIDMLMHELKNPLSGIKGASQLIEFDVKDNENLLELSQLITIESDRIVSLLNRIEQISTNNIKLEFESINIHEILSHCRRVAQNSFGSNIEFIEEYDPSLPKILIDKNLMIQVILNLLKNAAEAYNTHGKVKIKTTYNSNNVKSFSQSGLQTSLPLQIEIIDFGKGIPAEMLPNIFNPFVTSKKEGKGLGLSIVASGLEEMNANIDVYSEDGFTCFRINFPLSKK
jgi:two-component system nitrogen regulation sensor histidine kinase GlnL